MKYDVQLTARVGVSSGPKQHEVTLEKSATFSSHTFFCCDVMRQVTCDMLRQVIQSLISMLMPEARHLQHKQHSLSCSAVLPNNIQYMSTQRSPETQNMDFADSSEHQDKRRGLLVLLANSHTGNQPV